MGAMDSTRPPVDLEHKRAALAPAPGPAVTTGDDTGPVEVDAERGTVTLIAAVTGTVDGVYDRIIPGAFTRTLREGPKPKVVLGHDWNRPIGRVTSIREYLPGDPRLPQRTGSGRPWPREAGALIAEVKLNTAVPAAKDALEMIKFYGEESSWSIGYRTVKSRQRGDVRELLDVDLYEISPVLHGAHPDARLIGVKGARPGYEVKATAAGPSRPTTRNRPGLTRVIACSVCRLPAAGVVPGGALRDGQSLICARCVGVMNEALDERVATIDPAEIEEVFGEPELTIEQEYEQAVEREEEYRMQPGGVLTRADHDPARAGRAWSAGDRRAAPRW